ncbi:cubilin-like [Ptychodera flava]|uniref:cubilin-like n=1 Tax=Ptychodera flava TaxID=63121 RepID=UPI00396A39EC
MTIYAEVPCGGSLTGPSGNISSPSYPSYYPHGVSCQWDITVDDQKLIKFTFHVFDLEDGYDYLYIGDANSEDDAALVELTGDELPKAQIIDTYSSWVQFTTDLSRNGQGFYLTYEEYDDELLIAKPCGGAFFTKPDTRLVIQSPNYPSDYNNNERCVWNVTASSPDTQLWVRFRDFVTEPGHDWVDVGNGLDETDLTTRERHHSGFVRPISWLSSAAEMWMTFTTDNSVTYRGFLIYIEERNDTDTTTAKPPADITTKPPMITTTAISITSPATTSADTVTPTSELTTPVPTPYCGGHIDVPATGIRVVTSPNYADDYDDNLLCEWTVSATPGRRIRFHVVDFRTEKRYDYLDVGDGHDMENEVSLVDRLTGNEKEQSYVSATDKLWMRFVTDHRKTYRGFEIHLSEENDCLNHNVIIPTGGSVMITSPNYPEKYENNVFCEWIIRTESGGNVRVDTRHLRTEKNYDWVDVGTGDNSMILTTRIVHESGNKKTPFEFYTPSDVIWLTFMTDHDKTYEGFEMTFYDDACVTQNLTALSGVILSANYPSDYPHNLDCVWLIHLPEGRHIHLRFIDFYVEKNYDKLLVGEGSDPDSDDYVELTDKQDGLDYRSEKNKLWLRFQTDWSKSKRGFNITYDSYDCPENYTVGYRYGCYKFVEEPGDWEDAREHCESTEDSDLVIIDNQDELDFVMQEMQASEFWVGYYDRAVEGTWMWVDCSTSTPWHDGNWAVDQPSAGPYEDCAITDEDGKWNDKDCRFTYPYVCEINPKPFDDNDKNVQNVEGRALSTSEIPVTWTISDYYCDVLGYYVKYYRTDWIGGAFIIDVPGGDSDQVLLEGLDSSTWYAMYVAAYTYKGRLDYVPGDPVQTHEVVKPPEPPPDSGKHCGGMYTVKDDSVIQIASPNYPDNYDNNELCEWYIDTTEGNTLLVHLRDLQTEFLFDWLDIGEGDDNSVDDSRVHHISGSLKPWRFWHSDSHQLWVTFTTDSTVTWRGFLLDIEVVFEEIPTEKPEPTEPPEVEPGCVQNITIPRGDSVDVLSPNYPENYDNDLECLWQVDTESGWRINVTFVDFETEFCHDWLEIGDSHNYNDLTTSILRISGAKDDQDPVYSVADKIWITFTSDYSITYGGFHLVLKEIDESVPPCGGQLMIPSIGFENVTSPNHPEHYNNLDVCKWTATAEDDSKEIMIFFEDFETESNYDWLEVGSGLTAPYYPSLLYRLSGTEISGSYTTPKHEAWFLWTSDNSVTARGFSMRVYAVDSCGGSLTGPSGRIMSPYHPSPYPHNSDCTWTITVAASKAIKITFSEFNMEDDYDFLYIGEGHSVGMDTVAELTGDALPKEMIVDSHVAWIRFKSDLSIDATGFILNYEEYSEELLPAKPCGGDHHVKYESTLYIQSPNYPRDYYNNARCEWNFTADAGMLIYVYFRDFTTEESFDWLDLGNGNDRTDLSSRIVHHSGVGTPHPQLSTGQHMWMTFDTDDTVVDRGFLVMFSVVNDTETSTPKPDDPVVTTPAPVECGGHVLVPSDGVVNITSPNYPDNYHPDLLCQWTVNTTSSRRIRVTYQDFYTERRFDYLEIGDGHDITNRDTRHKYHSGDRLPYPFTTQTSEIWLQFVTDSSISYRGFHITLQEEVGCEESRSVTIPSGGSVDIESPYHPDQYDNNMFCEWNIIADQGKNIRVSVVDFETERYYDWVDIGVGSNAIDLSTRLLHLSGDRSTDDYIMASDEIWMTFTSDPTVIHTGFKITFYDDGCQTETLTEPEGSILSPLYPGVYPHNSDCIWIIDVSEDEHFMAEIWLVFNDFELEDRYDNLLVGIGNDPYSEPDWTLTGSDLPDDIEIRSSTAWLRFRSDFSIAKKGFDISYTLECPHDYEFGHGGHCYKFTPGNSTWEEARDDCQEHTHGELVVIETQGELDYIRDKMANSAFWIGYNDKSEEGVWRWTDCSYSNEWQLSNWAPGEPTNGVNEDCAITTEAGQWADKDCSVMYYHVCEIIRKNYTQEEMNVDNVVGVALSPHSIHVSWNISDLNCDVLGYRVKYHRLDWAEGAFVVYVDGGKSSETTLTGLESSTWYMIYVAAQLRDNALDYVPGEPVQTHEVVKPPAPTPPPRKVCGGEFVAKNGTHLRITSPNYPDNYNNNEYCEWKISALDGNALLLHLRDQRTEYLFDFIHIGEGSDPSDTSSLQHEISGFLRQWEYWTSSTDEVWITFTSDNSITFRGFVIDIEEIFTEPPTEKPVPTEPVPAEECGGNITISAGGVEEIKSPNYPDQYDNDLECLWLINTESRARVNVTFLFFYTEYCHDWLEIGNGIDHRDLTTSALRLSGEHSPDPFFSSGSRVWMTFTSDYSVAFQGFHLLVSEMDEPDERCGRDIILPLVEGASETILTPNHPDQYNNDDYCKWTVSLEAPIETSGFAILMTINSFSLEANFDWLEVGSGSDEVDMSSLMYRLTGSDVEGSYSTASESIWLLFTSDNTLTDTGFSIDLVVVPACGGHFTAEPGNILSPIFPSMYPHGTLCTWTIDIPDADAIEIVFHVFDLEEEFDHLYVGEGLTPNEGYTFDLTGSELPKDTIVYGGQTWLKFTTDNTVAKQGFNLTYSKYVDRVLPAKDCSYHIILKEGGLLNLQSENYPLGYYNNHRCEWNVTTETGLPMAVTYRDFQTERYHDWLDIGSGLDNSDMSTRLRHSSGDYLPSQLLVNSPSLWMTFYTDDSFVFRGFFVVIEEYDVESSPPKPDPTTLPTTTVAPTPEICGSQVELTGDDIYNMTSPNYPYYYDDDLICEWLFNTTYGKRISVSIIDFSTEFRHDYMEYGNGFDPMVRRSRVRRVSGEVDPIEFTSETESIWFKFVTDNSVTDTGFFLQLQVRDECNYETTIPAGGSVKVTSPGYPDTYYENEKFCQWVVRSQSGNPVRFNILDFETERWFDWVDIGTGGYTADLTTRLLHISGSLSKDPREAHYTTSDSVWVTLTTDSTIRRRGFEIEFFDDGCTDTTFTTAPGQIVSPLYPNPYAHNADCRWLIALEDASLIRITIEMFDLELGYDRLLALDGDDPESGNTIELTGMIGNGTEYVTEGNELMLRLETDWSIARAGFIIHFTSDCPEDYEAGTGGKCYRFVEEGSSWDDARRECMTDLNGDLVIVNDEAELDFLRSKMLGSTFWIGLSYMEWDRDWQWVDCSSMTRWQREQWQGTVPRNPNDVGDETCAASNGNWTGYHCDTLHSYVCELNVKEFELEDLNPTDLSGVALSPFAISASWEAPIYACDILGYNISYGIVDEPWTSQTDYLEGAMNTEYQMTNLLSNTSYAIKVTSVTFRGTVEPGITTVVTTLETKDEEPTVPVPKPCGGDFTVKNGTSLEIVSPGYPGHYANNEYCEWIVRAYNGMRLRATIWEFNTEYGYDFLDLGNGDNPEDVDTRISRLSGVVEYRTHLSESEYLWLVFSSDGSVTAPGFLLEFDLVEPPDEDPSEKPEIGTTVAPTTCGGDVEVYDVPVSVWSPNYPSHYDNDLNCLWSISAPEGRRILITIVDFETEVGFDWVTMGTGHNSTNTKSVFKYLSGSVDLLPFDANSNKMWMTFTADYSGTRRGFNITFQELKSLDCGGTFRIPPGGHVGIFSPNYPAQYDNNEFCEWIIEAESTRTILTNVRSFITEELYDWVDIGHGTDSTDRSTMIKHMSGLYPTHQFSTGANKVWITFISDGSVTQQGFSIEFSEDAVCDGEYLTEPSGFIASPNFPNNYPNHIDCTWIIEVNTSRSVQIEFLNFETEGGYDWLYIGEGDDPSENEEHRFSGSELPPIIISEDNIVWLRFTTDYSVNYQGWFLLYEEVHVTPAPPTTTVQPTPSRPSSTPCTPCGGTLEDDGAPIISCPYPDGSYCEWKIIYPAEKYVHMHIIEFDIQAGFDWVYIGHGPNVTEASTMEQMSGVKGDLERSVYKIPDEVISPSNEAWIVFESSRISTKVAHFIIAHNSTDTAPPVSPPPPEEHELTDETGRITSPNWPAPYDNNLNILWTITVSKGLLVRITILDFSTEENFDFLTFGSGSVRGSRTIARLSGRLTGGGAIQKRDVRAQDDDLVFRSDDFAMWLELTTDDSIIDDGFQLVYDTLVAQEEFCGKMNLTDPEGVILSPNHPNEYPDNMDCVWVIRLPDGYEDHRVRVTFHYFDLEYREDYLITGSGDQVDENIISTFTGDVIPDPVTSFDSTMWLRFFSDESITATGFNITYTSTTDRPEPICPTLPPPVRPTTPDSMTSVTKGTTTKPAPTLPPDETFTATIIIYDGNSTWFNEGTVKDEFATEIAKALNDWCAKDPANCLVDDTVNFGSEHVKFLDLVDVDEGVVMDVMIEHPERDGEYALTKRQLEDMLRSYEEEIESVMNFDYEVIERSDYVTEPQTLEVWIIVLILIAGILLLILLVLLIVFCIRRVRTADKPWLKDQYHVQDVEKNKPGKSEVLSQEDVPEEYEYSSNLALEQNIYSFDNPGEGGAINGTAEMAAEAETTAM